MGKEIRQKFIGRMERAMVLKDGQGWKDRRIKLWKMGQKLRKRMAGEMGWDT